MTTHDGTEASPAKPGVWLSRIFWIVASCDVLLFLASLWNIWTYPRGQFDGLLVFVLYVLLGAIGVAMGIAALVRRPVAYGITLVVVAVPLLFLGIEFISITD